jgi:hypothetical protein
MIKKIKTQLHEKILKLVEYFFQAKLIWVTLANPLNLSPRICSGSTYGSGLKTMIEKIRIKFGMEIK